jgi:hypothetical protein
MVNPVHSPYIPYTPKLLRDLNLGGFLWRIVPVMDFLSAAF